MKLYWRKDSPEHWDRFFKTMNDAPESVEFRKGFIDRHIPIAEDTLKQWEKEVDSTSYGQTLKDDISWARKCNKMQDEVLVWRDKE